MRKAIKFRAYVYSLSLNGYGLNRAYIESNFDIEYCTTNNVMYNPNNWILAFYQHIRGKVDEFQCD